jgi:hypothetical protein
MKKIFILVLLTIVGCSKDVSIPGDHGAVSALLNKEFFEQVGSTKPYNPSASFVAKMEECIYADTAAKSCTVADLPLIGISHPNITVQNILDRTMVTHDFLGTTFKEVLERMNPEMLQMFGAVSAIVISDKINPSFYFSTSGTIYLSGRYFWRNKEERDIVIQAKDAREGAGLPFQFIFDHDYIKDKKSITSRAKKDVQSYDEMAINTSRLLFHELTHANDYFPRNAYGIHKIDLSRTYQSIAHQRYIDGVLASDLQPTHLASKKLKHIGQVLFQGADATAADGKIMAEEVIDEFKNDLASDAYAYSTSREDFAMCAEEALMLYYYNIARYVVVIKLPEANFIPPADYDYPIAWGEKSRVLQPAIKKRAIYAIEIDLGNSIGKKISEKLDKSSTVNIPALSTWELVYAL